MYAIQKSNMNIRNKSSLKRRYTAALDTSFSADRCVLKKEGIKQYFSHMEDNEILNLIMPGYINGIGHALLLVKEEGKYYLYDANMGNVQSLSLDDSTDFVVDYLKEFQDFGSVETYVLFSERLKYPKQNKEKRNKSVFKLSKRPIPQEEFLDIVAAYFNAVYKPTKAVSAEGLCAGLSVILRELIVQTGSVEQASEMFHSYIEEIALLERKHGARNNEGELVLDKDVIDKLKNSKLILSMIPFFHSLQDSKILAAKTSNTWSEMTPVDDLGNRISNGAKDIGLMTLTLPLSIEMEIDGKNMLSNPSVIYQLFDESLSDEEYDEMLANLKVKEVFSKDRMSCTDVKNEVFMMAAIDRNIKAIKYAKVPDTKVVFTLYKIYKLGLDKKSLVAAGLRESPFFIELACQENPKAIQYAASELKNDPDYILNLIGKGINVLEFLPENLKGDGDFMWEAIKKDENLYYLASFELQDNMLFICLYFYSGVKNFLVKTFTFPKVSVDDTGVSRVVMRRNSKEVLKEEKSIVSSRTVIEGEIAEESKQLLDSSEGGEVEGFVKNLNSDV